MYSTVILKRDVTLSLFGGPRVFPSGYVIELRTNKARKLIESGEAALVSPETPNTKVLKFKDLGAAKHNKSKKHKPVKADGH